MLTYIDYESIDIREQQQKITRQGLYIDEY